MDNRFFERVTSIKDDNRIEVHGRHDSSRDERAPPTDELFSGRSRAAVWRTSIRHLRENAAAAIPMSVLGVIATASQHIPHMPEGLGRVACPATPSGLSDHELRRRRFRWAA